MQTPPAIAILAPNILMGMGLETLLEKVIPHAEVELFDTFEAFEETSPERFFHFFVAAQLFIAHSDFFRQRHHKTFLLTDGQPRAAYAGMHCLNVFTSQESIVCSLLQMRQGSCRQDHTLPEVAPAQASLSAREAEVLALLAAGCISKEIAERLGIGLTTVLSHRRNIMSKLNIRSVAELAIYAVRAGYAVERL